MSILFFSTKETGMNCQSYPLGSQQGEIILYRHGNSLNTADSHDGQPRCSRISVPILSSSSYSYAFSRCRLAYESEEKKTIEIAMIPTVFLRTLIATPQAGSPACLITENLQLFWLYLKSRNSTRKRIRSIHSRLRNKRRFTTRLAE